MGFGIWILGFVLTSLSVTACGKKGPPLAPIVRVPAAVDQVSAQRVGHDIYLTVTIPTQNIDTSTPADVSRIDIFGVTSLTPPPRARIFEIASKVASIDVQPATRPGDEPAPLTTAQSALPVQGAAVIVRDAMTAADLVPRELAAAPGRTVQPQAVTTTPPAPFPHRYYVAVATSDRGRSGPPGTLVDVPLPPLPDAPGSMTSTHDADAVTLSWEPAGGVVGFLLQTPAPLEPAPVDEPADGPDERPDSVAAGPVLYNVYREPVPAAAGASATVAVVPPVPINAAPLAALTYTDSTPFEFGQPRCYSVRAVRGTGANAVLSPPSERHCLTPEDRFPPVAPTGLNSIAADGVISLLWEPNGEADLGGYLILRGRPGDATLQPLTPTPVREERYDDRDVMPGARYVYAVKAVDTHSPTPNVSDESNRVEETAR